MKSPPRSRYNVGFLIAVGLAFHYVSERRFLARSQDSKSLGVYVINLRLLFFEHGIQWHEPCDCA